MRPCKRKALPDTPEGKLRDQREYLNAKVRAMVEHPFHVVKNRFHHRKTTLPWPSEKPHADIQPVWVGQFSVA